MLMAPLRESSSWMLRYKEQGDILIEPFRRYYLIFEGAYTEVKYFQGIDDNRKSLRIHNSIEIVFLHKDGELQNQSNPKKLLELVNQKKEELKNSDQYEDIDRFVIVFDRDSFKTPEKYLEFVNLAEKDNILAITSPCFELWLLLHYDGSVDIHIRPNQKEILKNKKESNNHTFMSKKFASVSGMNSKSNLKVENLIKNVDTAIIQEKTVSQVAEEMATAIGSNIGVLIEELRKDPREMIYLNLIFISRNPWFYRGFREFYFL